MSDDLAELAAFFLSSRVDVAQLELIEIAHPNFTRTYRIVRNAAEGVTVDLSPDEQNVFFEYYPAKFKAGGVRDDLDTTITINLGDLGEVLPLELDEIMRAGGLRTKLALRYWVFRSDDLSAPILGPIPLEGPSITFDGTYSTIEARAPRLNTNRTGERYKVERFPMLRGFLK